MHPVVGLLQYIPYNLILNRIISGKWGPAVGTLLLVLPNVNFAPTNFAAPPPILETENCVASQCSEFYSEDLLVLSQAIYLGLLWLGLIVLLNPETASYYPVISVTVGFFEDGKIDSVVFDDHGLCFPTYTGVQSGEPVHACYNVVVYVVHDKSFDGRLYALEVNSEGSCFAFK
ncbi:hypothetical protein DSO57_1030936 [Entomophthora muscae]|uniref:Uncharacterized protein n=1 Tax=Entomophthora muscae TaxID=34485 RepID=A0ACC2T0W0_9FUNG|nr:hypothetical protein DSO57_1030936 [Entomophthora muscae]